MKPWDRRELRGERFGLPAIVMCGWERQTAARYPALGAHEHGEAYEVCYIADGCVEWWVEHEVHEVRAGQVYLTRPAERHGGVDEVMHPSELFWVIFRFPSDDALPGMTRDETAALAESFAAMRHRCFTGSSALEAAYRDLLASQDEPEAQRLLVMRTAFHALLLELVRCHERHEQQRGALSAQIAAAMRWMDDRVSENFNLDDVAVAVGLGISQFHARFRKEAGVTPAVYRTRGRIRLAKRLLRETEQSVTAIAMACGFTTSQYFATAFKRQVGMSAQGYRERYGGNRRVRPSEGAHPAASARDGEGRSADERSESRGSSARRWRHIVLHTRGAWLPGDPRGFRSRGHKIHSSGDYKNPPPRGEHAGLYAYSKQLRPRAVTIPADLRGVVGRAMIDELAKQGRDLLAIAVCAQHVHLLVDLPGNDAVQWDVVGDCKRVASHAVRSRLPGAMWGRKGRIEAVTRRAHHAYLYKTYIPGHGGEGGWVWNFRDGVVCDPG